MTWSTSPATSSTASRRSARCRSGSCAWSGRVVSVLALAVRAGARRRRGRLGVIRTVRGLAPRIFEITTASPVRSALISFGCDDELLDLAPRARGEPCRRAAARRSGGSPPRPSRCPAICGDRLRRARHVLAVGDLDRGDAEHLVAEARGGALEVGELLGGQQHAARPASRPRASSAITLSAPERRELVDADHRLLGRRPRRRLDPGDRRTRRRGPGRRACRAAPRACRTCSS